MPEGVGVIYGQVGSTRFDVAVHDGSLRRLDYIAVEHNGREVLGQVQEVVRKSKVSFDEAMRLHEREHDVTGDQLSAGVQVIGFVDAQGRVQSPRTPFSAGLVVRRADDHLVTSVLGLQSSTHDGAHLGMVKGSDIPVSLSLNTLAQKHVSVLAKTGAGKSYTVGVILEEFLRAEVPLVILDPHGEYGSLRHANIEEREVKAMRRHGVKPRSFAKQIAEFAIDTRINPEAERLVLEGMNLEGREIVDLMGSKISGGQVGVLYQAVKEVKDHLPAYTLKDVMDAVGRNRSSAKWNVLNALEALDATKVFDIRGTPISELVKPGQATIINLKGISPDIQEVVVTRVTNLLWEARKRNEVPPHILVCEEAHNFCPERGVGNAISGPVLRTVASEGRKFGMGLVIVSQRPAKIDKNVLSQCNTQVVLKVTNPNDLKAIVASVEGITSETADEVQRLPIGSALVAGGRLTQPVFVEIRPRLTRHGGRSIDVVGGGSEKAETKAPSAPARPSPVPPRPVEPERVSAPEPEPVEAPEPFVPEPDPEPEPEPELVIVERKAAREARKPMTFRQNPEPADEPPQPFRITKREPASDADTHTHSQQNEKAPPVREQANGSSGVPQRRRPTAKPPSWDKKDHTGIARVAKRIGIVTPGADTQRTIDMVQGLAIRNGRDPDQRLGLYAEIARRVCHDDAPVCIRCPVKDMCEFHAAMENERHKSRNPIRRLWRR